jgi:hypothetical protein
VCQLRPSGAAPARKALQSHDLSQVRSDHGPDIVQGSFHVAQFVALPVIAGMHRKGVRACGPGLREAFGLAVMQVPARVSAKLYGTPSLKGPSSRPFKMKTMPSF